MGYLQSLLNVVVFFNMLLDGLSLILSWDMLIVYLYAFSFTGSFLVMCAVVTALQERNAAMLAYTRIWIVMKMVILSAMSIIAVSGLLDLYFTDRELFEITMEQKLLLPTVFVTLVFMGVQHFLTNLNVRLVAEMPKLFSESRLSMAV
ncbi:hypothetical protein QR680_017762 [Steinernema hermaphroditum]|uniref:Uncharacterized protein n=1 Tax=Steinernema hermaphroditum TaxID=289476 RepID=A0AA39LPW0_9BILA|nr:hypothetical protein QR680_017762 [Steinernema hermaphroditum]